MQPYPNSNPQHRATNAYKTSSYHGRSEAELMAEVMSKMIKQLYAAQEACANRQFDVMVGHNAKTFHILDVLREELVASEAFNDPEALPAAKFLLQTYTDVIARLADVLKAPSPKDEYSALIEKLTVIFRAWRAAAPAETSAPSNVHVANNNVAAI